MVVAQGPLRDRSIRYVKGVGPNRLNLLAELGIQSVEDACYFPPRRYEDRTHLVAIADARPGSTVIVRGRISARSMRRIRGGRSLVEAAFTDGTGTLQAVWFNQPYLVQQLTIGDEFILYGEVEQKLKPQMVHPELERVEPGDESSIHMGRIVPVYPLVSGLNQRWFRQTMATVLEAHAGSLEELLPESLRQARGWPGVARAVSDLHFPESWDALEAAKRRLAFEELFLFQLALAQRRARTAATAKPQRYALDGPLTRGLRARLPFALTAGQERVVAELFADLAQPHPMHRLLQGDVGCGKTVVMALCIAAAIQSGWQAALMAPTELLAEQHVRTLTGYLEPLGVSVALLSQGVSAADRKKLATRVGAGEIQLVIGTHALIQSGVAFKKLGLAVIDEQHKFGVVQRAHLAGKAEAPDVLVVTATPIPRTLALTIYGDLDAATITQMPAGRQPIATRWLRESQRDELYAAVRKELAQGRQAYVVYPFIEQSERELRAASQMAKHLAAGIFPEFKVGLLHGRMKPALKDSTMRAFARGDINLLVSTAIVEVGLDVANATVMVIEQPQRFGLAQLHQLRGRIGRGAHPATCFVIADAEEGSLRERLEAFVETTDGFELAERDLQLRGPGELMGRRQSGWMRFRLAQLARDQDLLESARHEAEQLVGQDPDLRDPSLAPLRQRLVRFRQESV